MQAVTSAAFDVRGKLVVAQQPNDTVAGRVMESVKVRIVDGSDNVIGTATDEITAAIAAQPNASVLELGLTSAQGISFKGWVFKQLEAELTTFQLLKQPFNLMIEAIDTAQREGVGAVLPDLPVPP